MNYTVVSSTVVSGKGVNGVGSNGRKPYVAPVTDVVCVGDRPLMVIVSPGVGSDYNPGDDIDAKRLDLDIEFRDLWEE